MFLNVPNPLLIYRALETSSTIPEMSLLTLAHLLDTAALWELFSWAHKVISLCMKAPGPQAAACGRGALVTSSRTEPAGLQTAQALGEEAADLVFPGPEPILNCKAVVSPPLFLGNAEIKQREATFWGIKSGCEIKPFMRQAPTLSSLQPFNHLCFLGKTSSNLEKAFSVQDQPATGNCCFI